MPFEFHNFHFGTNYITAYRPDKLDKLKQYDDIKMKQLTICIVPKNQLAGKLIDVSFTNVRAYFNGSGEQAKNEKHTRLG